MISQHNYHDSREEQVLKARSDRVNCRFPRLNHEASKFSNTCQTRRHTYQPKKSYFTLFAGGMSEKIQVSLVDNYTAVLLFSNLNIIFVGYFGPEKDF